MEQLMNILFIFAHPDDEAYGPAGTIAQLSKNNKVTVISLCKGDRPGNEQVSDDRIEAFEKSCETLGASFAMCSGSDCKLEYCDTLSKIETFIKNLEPEIIYTNNISDIHKDHRLVAECVLVASRPKPESTVKELYMCEMPSSTDWSFGQLGDTFQPNYYRDVSMEIYKKQQVMGYYNTETYNYPDARSIESMESLAMYRGKQVGVHRAEAFKLIFSIK
jgi:LmbE family N-acetylglucosaminyl deacetylase